MTVPTRAASTNTEIETETALSSKAADEFRTSAGRSPLTSTFAMPHFRTPAFEGPLDLLLHLIRVNEVAISDIPIADITEQYLAYIDMFEALDLAVAGEYVLMAASLIELKSRLLLPQPPPTDGEDEGEDPRAELVSRLIEYNQYQGVVGTLREWEELRRSIFFRGAVEGPGDFILPVPIGEAKPAQLYQALQRLLVEAGLDGSPVSAVTPRRRLSLRLKMAEIARLLESVLPQGVQFESLFALPCARYDIVITFLALLELLRIGRARYEQDGTHAPIRIYGVPREDAQ